METPIDPALLPSDAIVLQNLLQARPGDDAVAVTKLRDLEKEPVIFTGRGVSTRFLRAYTLWAGDVVRKPVDIVFLTHILLYLCTSVPSAIYLYVQFNRMHGILHWIMQLSYCGPFTLMLHNHIHQNGLLKKRFAWFDQAWPIILEPLMGHSWHSYYYHHVKHHHIEGNGPGDLSSTIRYQRDELSHFLMYLSRFLFLIWYELPRYFLRKGHIKYAVKSALFEISSYILIIVLALWKLEPTFWALILPLIQMRIGLMVGNFGQHAFVDDIDPASDFRSSITLIDVNSNRHCFNDGYHTSHHLNPLRHWREHPRAFISAKGEYSSSQALVFRNIDYLMITYRLLRKDYDHLADCLVPIGEQKAMTKSEIADMLRTKTKRFTEEEIQDKFHN